MSPTWESEPQAFRALLKHYRLMAGLTQEMLAERSGISLRAISDLERGVRRLPHRDTVRLLAQGAGLNAEDRRALEQSVDRHRRIVYAAQPSGRARPRFEAAALPLRFGPLIGREAELPVLSTLLRQSRTRLLTLTGPAGVGKTALALATAALAASSFLQDVRFIDLATIRLPERVLGTIEERLCLGSGGSALDALRRYYRDRVALLVLDNFEQVLPAAIALPDLLAACPGLRLLVTSREPLHLRVEQTFSVSTLALPDPARAPTPSALVQVPAVALFIERARAIAPGFSLTAQNARAVAELCIRLDGLPLAIELAAARIALLSPEMLLERLNDRLSVLRWQAQDLPERQWTLRAAIAWSYDLLDQAEQALFRRLGVFAGGFTLQAAQAVDSAGQRAAEGDLVRGPRSSKSLDVLASLVAKSLVVSATDGTGERRFRLLESIRDYAVEQLVPHGELEATQEAHAAYFHALAEEAAPELKGPRWTWNLRLEEDLDNLRAALQWLYERHAENGESALRLALALSYFWQIHDLRGDWRRWLELTLAAAPGAALKLRARALASLGDPLNWPGQPERARGVLEEALALSRSLGEPATIFEALLNLGTLAAFAEDALEAQRLLGDALRTAQEAGDYWAVAHARMRIGSAAILAGEYEQGEAELEQAVSQFRDVGDQFLTGMASVWLALTAGWRGDGAGARGGLEGSLQLAAELRSRHLLSLIAQTLVLLAGGHFSEEEAATLLGAVDALNLGSEPQLLPVFPQLQEVYAALRERLGADGYEQAQAAGRQLSFDETLALARDMVAGTTTTSQPASS